MGLYDTLYDVVAENILFLWYTLKRVVGYVCLHNTLNGVLSQEGLIFIELLYILSGVLENLQFSPT